MSSIIITATNVAKAKANQAKVATDVHALQTSLELYKTQTGSYPYECTGTHGDPVSDPNNYCSPTVSYNVNSSDLGMLVTNNDISELPTPPTSDYTYTYVPVMSKPDQFTYLGALLSCGTVAAQKYIIYVTDQLHQTINIPGLGPFSYTLSDGSIYTTYVQEGGGVGPSGYINCLAN